MKMTDIQITDTDTIASERICKVQQQDKERNATSEYTVPLQACRTKLDLGCQAVFVESTEGVAEDCDMVS
jgi:hypothetical protein